MDKTEILRVFYLFMPSISLSLHDFLMLIQFHENIL